MKSTVTGIFLLSFIFLGLLMDCELNIFDEGIILSNAMRVGAGEVVHRDFYSSYGPGSYYLVAGLFELFDARFLAARVYGIAVMAGIAALTSAALLGRVELVIAGLGTAACVLLLFASPYYLYPSFPCLLFALTGCLLLVRPHAPDRSGILFGAGACAGAAAYFRYDAGFFILVSHLAAVAALLAVERPSGTRLIPIVRAGIIYAAGAGLVFLPGLAAYLASAPVSAFVADIITYSTDHYAEMRGLPFPGPRALVGNPGETAVYLPIVAVSAALLEICRRRASDGNFGGDPRTFASLVVFTALTAGLYYKGVVRVSTIHMLMSVIPGIILLAICANAWWPRGRLGRRAALGAMLVAVVPAAASACLQTRVVRHHPARTLAGWLVDRAGSIGFVAEARPNCPQIPAMWLARQPSDYAAVSRYIRARSAPGERIFIGLNRHDRIFINPVSLYFAAGRLPATHWHQFDPGLQTRADIQVRIVRELRAGRIRWVVRDKSFEGSAEPNGSSRSSGVHVLDRFLDANYRPVAASGPIAIWLANGVPTPLPASGEDAVCMPTPV